MLKNYIIPTVLLTSFMLMSFTTFKHDYNNSAIEKLDLFQKKDTVTWKQLARIDFVKKKDKAFGEVMFPVINASLKTKQGKKIVAKGFIVPIDNKTYKKKKQLDHQSYWKNGWCLDCFFHRIFSGGIAYRDTFYLDSSDHCRNNLYHIRWSEI